MRISRPQRRMPVQRAPAFNARLQREQNLNAPTGKYAALYIRVNARPDDGHLRVGHTVVHGPWSWSGDIRTSCGMFFRARRSPISDETDLKASWRLASNPVVYDGTDKLDPSMDFVLGLSHPPSRLRGFPTCARNGFLNVQAYMTGWIVRPTYDAKFETLPSGSCSVRPSTKMPGCKSNFRLGVGAAGSLPHGIRHATVYLKTAMRPLPGGQRIGGSKATRTKACRNLHQSTHTRRRKCR